MDLVVNAISLADSLGVDIKSVDANGKISDSLSLNQVHRPLLINFLRSGSVES